MSLHPLQRRFLLKVLPYPIIALLSGLLYFDIEIGLLGSSDIYPSTGNAYDPVTSLVAISIMTFLLGLFLGIMEETVFKNNFRNLPFALKLLLKTFLYMLVLLFILLIFSFILNSLNQDKPFYDEEIYRTVILFFTSFTLLSIVIYSGFMIGINLFFSEIVDYLGLDVVGSFFTGKYAKPVIESRVFMFLDMKDSTTIAEKLGHKKHYELINEYYADMTTPIVQTHGSIYQYAGDEIVVSWTIEKGLKDSNCLRCFFLIEKAIEAKADRYQSKYGTVPQFKAGLHMGEITRGQVGVIKRDMLYTGDVLNTTARIQSLCNEQAANLLISARLKAALPTNAFTYTEKGSFKLRGRNEKEELFEVT